MGAASFVGRVGGLAVALGIGVAVASGTAVATADSSRDSSDGAGRSQTSSESTRGGTRANTSMVATRGRGVAPAAAATPEAAPDTSVAIPDQVAIEAIDPPVAPRSAASFRVAPTVPDAVVSDPVSDAADPPAPLAAASVPAPSAAVTSPAPAVVVAPAASNVLAPPNTDPVAQAAVADPVAPDPDATVDTAYGDLGKWMLNKDGEIADWVGIPYCGSGTCKTMQEPINVIFTVQAKSKWWAEAILNFKLRRAGFPPSCCSSVGYKAILDEITSQQMPRGGILGVGVLGPGNFQRGLLGLLAGIGPAYRDAFFMTTNSHMRTFGGVSDGNGNWVFTGSVSKEYYTTVDGKPTHGYESFDQARDKLLSDMVAAGNTDLGLVAMHNAIPADDPNYTTGDADGFAQVIAITGLASMAWRPFERV